MWTMEDVLSELREEGGSEKVKSKNGMAPGFRFHPTDEELITFYLASKVFYSHNITTTPFHIVEVDLNRCEPWDLPELAKMGEKEWYIYSLRDRKYPTGLRTNRATETGYWKATGKDRQVHAGGSGVGTGTAGHGLTGSSGSTGLTGSGLLIGMKKTLVFYQGRAPRGVKTRWVMHEYRLDGLFSSFRFSSKEEWVICRIFLKHGCEKRTPFHPPPPPLSPFLRCLPPLLDVPTTTSSSSSTTTRSLQNPTHHHHNNNNNKIINDNNNNNIYNNNNNNNNNSDIKIKINNVNNNNNNIYNNNNDNDNDNDNDNNSNYFQTYNNSNFLLNSLLSNPLPNFSSLPNNDLFITTTNTTTTATVDRLPILFTMIQHDPHSDPFGVREVGEIIRGDVEDDVAVRFDMSSSTIADLDRLFHHPHHHINNFSSYY